MSAPSHPRHTQAPSGHRAARAEVRLCGHLSVTIDGRSRALPRRQGRALFVHLVLNRGRAVTRDELLELLWPDRPSDTSAPLLASLLSRTRRTLPPGTLTGRSALRLELGDDAWVDIEAAARAVPEAARALASGDPGRAQAIARDAIAAVAQPLLPGVDLDWVEEHRRMLRDVEIALLEASARAALALGEPELAHGEAAARRAIRLEPLRESAHALLIHLQAARGNQAEALRTYHGLRTLLRDELGMVPSRPVRDLASRLLADEVRGDRALTVTRIRGRAEHRHAIRDTMRAAEVHAAGRPGCRLFRYVASLDDPDEYLNVQEWIDGASFAAYQRLEAAEVFRRRLRRMTDA